jgi:hypothetical protein
LALIPALQEEGKDSLIVKIIESKVCTAIPWLKAEATVNTIVSRVSIAILEQLGVKQVSRSQEIRGAMDIST